MTFEESKVCQELRWLFDKQAEEMISDEEKQRILAPVLEKIKADVFSKEHRAEHRKREMITHAIKLLHDYTSTGKIIIVVISE